MNKTECKKLEADKAPITKILAEHGVAVENQASLIRRASIACPALPTCGLALAEAERLNAARA